MLSDRQIEALARIFEQRMQVVVDQYLREMGAHLRDIGQLLPSDVNRLVEIKRVDTAIDRIRREISAAAGRSAQGVEEVLAAVAASDYAFARAYYGEDAQAPLVENTALLRILQAQTEITLGEMRNLSQTTILSQRYRNAVDVAIQTVQAGITDYNSAIRAAMIDAAQEGLRVRYPRSGLTRRLDTAVRMNILDGIRTLRNDILWQIGREFGADGVEISAHALCAEDHLPCQGKRYTMAEFEALQQRLRRPIGIWNCKHVRFPVMLGVSEPTYSPEQLERMRKNSSAQIEIDGDQKSRYEWSQEQRRIETAIRRHGDIITAAEAVPDQAAVAGAKKMISALLKQYERISEAAGLELNYERTAVIKIVQRR